MIGGSYGGQIQYAVASLDSRLDAIVPIITWNDLSYSLAPNNTDLSSGVTYRTPGVAKKEWIDLFFGAGIASGAQSVTIDPETMAGCPNFRTRPARPPRSSTPPATPTTRPWRWPDTPRCRRTCRR